MDEYMDNDVQETDDEIFSIDLKKYVDIAKSNWKKILLWGFASAVLGGLLSFGIPREYKVVSKVAPELSLRSNSLTSLASMAGINMNMLSNNNDALLPTVYPEIIKSVPFVTDLFSMPANDTTLYAYIKDETKDPLISTVLSWPFKLLGAVVSKIKGEEVDVNGTVDTYHLTREQFMIYKKLARDIKVEVDKKSFLVTVTVTAQSPYVAADMSRAVIENLKRYVTEYRTGKAKQNADFLEVALEKARTEYYESQSRYARYCDTHQEMLSQSNMVEKQRLQNDMNLKYQLFSSMSQQYQQAQITVRQETPVFAEVVSPTIPVRKSKPSRSKYAICFALLGIAGVMVYSTKKYGK